MDAKIHFFHCGNGDTILIGGGKDEWALVDANLTHRSGAGLRLAAALRENQVERLRFVCVTHFDQDHIRGLGSFLRDHFGPGSRSPDGRPRDRWAIDQVIVPIRHDVRWEFCNFHRRLFEHFRAGSRVRSEFEELFAVLFEIAEHEEDCFRCYAAGTRLIERGSPPRAASLGPWEVAFLGPGERIESRYTLAFRNRWGLSAWPREEQPRELRLAIGNNETSRIIALRHRESGDTILLTGDAPATSIEEALGEWESLHRDSAAALRKTFRVVKASHHGAWTSRSEDNCHHSELYERACETDRSHVVVSCRDHDEHHPHSEFLVCLKGARLECRSTGVPLSEGRSGTRRGAGAPCGSPQRVASRTAEDIVVSHDENGFAITGGHVCVAFRAES